MITELVLTESKNTTTLSTDKIPVEAKTFQVIVSESGLTTTECSCIINTLVDKGTVKKTNYIVGYESYGKPIYKTYYEEVVGATEVKSEEQTKI